MNIYLNLTRKRAQRADENQIVTDDRKTMYNNNRVKRTGDKVEKLFRWMAERYLEVDKAWLAKAGCELDEEYKVDLVLELDAEPETCRCIQVKTTKAQAKEHLALGSVKKGKFDICGVVHAEDSHLGMLRQLHEVSGLPFSKRATGVFKLAQQFKGQKVISMAFPHLIEDFQFFGLARYVNNGEEVLFVDDPPDLLLE
jgi:hypothetical protein